MSERGRASGSVISEKPVVVYPETLSKKLFTNRTVRLESLNALSQKYGIAPRIPRIKNTPVRRIQDWRKSSSSRTERAFREKPKKKNVKLVTNSEIIACVSL
ncbi:hypothetical protein MNV_1690005 [Candidatus Methanoperedens nitroreducens]|uniref:Uncharacterized protein n=1 Tax=Candidatus Methanoperedens nitratireducens TaxID=1392998 RepID=A0A284VLP7_9EURY|nr:hypothetical protein MNV_1690005 [Candidatus Methanoperedens nitroreducens]